MNKTENPPQQVPPPERLYRPRQGEGLDYYIDVLANLPESPLSEEQTRQVIAFENSLMDGKFKSPDGSEVTVTEKRSLAELADQTSYSQKQWELTVDYFLTDEGRQDLEAFGIPAAAGSDIQTVGELLKKHALGLPKNDIRELNIKSENYAEKVMAEALLEGREIEDPRRIVVFNDAADLLERTTGFFAYHRFYRDVGRTLKDAEPTLTNMAQQAILRIYRKKTNHVLAIAEPNLMLLWEQSECMDEEAKNQLQMKIRKAWPTITLPKAREVNVVRLDRLRNGASFRNGKFSGISEALDKLLAAGAIEQQESHEPPVFTPVEVAMLDEVVFDAAHMQKFCRAILQKLGKLSEQPESDYDPDRPTRAADGKWQVPIRKDLGSMSVEDPPGAWAIPSDFERSVTKLNPPVGAAPGAIHEPEHIYQCENVRNNQSGLRMGKEIKSKGSTVLREAGTLSCERALQQRLFGRYRRDNPYYVRSLRVLEEGGGELDAVVASFASQLELNPDYPKEKAATESIGRVKRLRRRMGGFDSQALNYAESSLIAATTSDLDERTRDILFSEGGLGLEDLAELHRFGLLTSNPEPFPQNQIIELIGQQLKEELTTLDTSQSI